MQPGRALLASVAVLLLGIAPTTKAAAEEARPQGAVTVANSSEIVIGSQALGEDLRLLVWQPPGPVPEEGFPVLYALDGGDSFGALSDFAAALAPAARRAGLAPAMVVAIGYGDAEGAESRRIYDYTPPAGSFDMPVRPNGKPWPRLGGGDRLRQSIREEIKPLITNRYPVDTEAEMLFGHSLGGLMALYVLSVDTDLFDAYAASSPSLWVNDRQLIRELPAFLDKKREQPIPLLLTVGTEEETLSDWERLAWPDEAVRLAWIRGNRMVGNARDLAALIGNEGANVVALSYQELAGQNHSSAKAIAAFAALERTVDLGRMR